MKWAKNAQRMKQAKETQEMKRAEEAWGVEWIGPTRMLDSKD